MNFIKIEKELEGKLYKFYMRQDVLFGWYIEKLLKASSLGNEYMVKSTLMMHSEIVIVDDTFVKNRFMVEDLVDKCFDVR